MANRGEYKGGKSFLKEGNEIISAGFPVQFYDDFVTYKLHQYIANESTTAPWTTVKVGTPTTDWAVLANASNGVVTAALAATDEAERMVLYMGDQLAFNINTGLIFETRISFPVLPTTGTEKAIAVWGLASADNATADTIATNLWFRAEGDANIVWESDDNSTNDDDNDTGVDLVADVWHVYRIDCTVATAPKFYIDGVDYTTTTTQTGACAMAAATATTARVQPYFAVEKAKSVANTGVATMSIDYVKIWQNRS